METSRIYLLATLLVILAGCNLLENDLINGRPRASRERSGGVADSVKYIKSPDDSVLPELIFDTTVFVSAVRCCSDYDWRRDSDYGCADAELLLYRNGEVVMSIPAGDGRSVSAAPDLHHILDGHLYTEYCDYSKTVIGCDGEELFSFNGREFLKGLLIRGDDVYTLSESVTAGGFKLRKNGVEVLSNKSGSVFGDFDDPSYGKCGALYEDGGAVCFAYEVKSACYLVRDGVAAQVPGAGILDLKSVGGKNVPADKNSLGHIWKDARIWRMGTSYLISGESADVSEDGIFLVVNESGKEEAKFKMTDALIYCYGGVFKALDRDTMERISYCFSSRCAALMGDGLLVLNTPRDGGTPYMAFGDKKTLFDGLDGYLTGASATISLPNTLPVIHR